MTTLLTSETPAVSSPGTQQTFSINFIKQKTVPLKFRRAAALAAVFYLALNGILAAGFLGSGAAASLQSLGLKNKLSKLAAGPITADSLEQDMEPFYSHAAQSLDGLNRVIASGHQRFPVGGKIAAVVKTLPNRTWITSFSSKHPERTLRLEALYLVDPKAPNKLPLKTWERALRADAVFSQGLKKLSLGQTSSVKQGKADCVRFDLVAEW